MPYIKKERAQELNISIEPMTPGELNYMLTDTCILYLERVYGKDANYAQRAEVVAALECAKLEFYRRAMADYEDRKLSDPDNVDPYV